MSSCRIIVRGGLFALALALLGSTPVMAQFRTNPALLANQPGLETAGFVRPVGMAPGFAPVANPFWGGGWGMMTPAYGLLSGTAELTTAVAQAKVTNQQARLANQQVLQTQLDTRKAILEQARWEEAMKPTAETMRDQQRELAVRRALNDPPLTEIASGQVLNALMEQARRNMLAGIPGPMVPLDPTTLKHINVTTGTTSGGSAVARDTENLRWPLVLQAPRWKDLRDTINTSMSNALLQARASGIEFETDKQLNDAIRQLDRQVDDAVTELTPTEFVQARRFVKQLQETRRTLGDASASNYLNGKFTAQGNNVAELFNHMQTSGLRFAPARPGDETFYRSLHYSMVSYVATQATLTAQAPRPQVNPYANPQP